MQGLPTNCWAVPPETALNMTEIGPGDPVYPSHINSSMCFLLRERDKIYTMTTEQSSHSNVDMMDDFTLFRFNEIIKEKANLAPGKTPTLILTDSSGKKRLSFGNLGQLQEIREQKALIDAGSDISLSPSEEKDVRETEGECLFLKTKQNDTFLSLSLLNCFVLIICDFFFAGNVFDVRRSEGRNADKAQARV